MPGGPTHYELLSTSAQALALLRNPSHRFCAHTWPERRCAFCAHRRDLTLLLVFRAQVGSEATDPILMVDNATYMLHIRVGVACLAALEVLSDVAFTRAVQRGGVLAFRARARL